MKTNISLAFLLILFFTSCTNTGDIIEEEALGLLEDNRLFELRELYEPAAGQFSEMNSLLIEAHLDHTFNRNIESNMKIEALMESYSTELEDSIIADLLSLKALNYMMLFDYAEASRTNQVLLDSMAHVMDSSSLKDIRTMQSIYKPLSGVPPQQVIVKNTERVQMTRDIANLLNVDMQYKGDTYSLIFDTGAGMSVIKRGIAEELGLKLIETSIDVNAATGNVVKSSLALADTLHLGEVLILNAVFLVMEDKALEFPQANYYPLGAIGFPVIEEFGEIIITKEDSLIIHTGSSSSGLANMRFQDLQPRVFLFNGKDTLPFAFDTGARKSHLTSDYYNLYIDEFDSALAPDTIQTYSAGGRQNHLAFNIDSMSLYIGEEVAHLFDITCHTNHLETFSGVYGNLGQDLVTQFDRLVLNFREMFLMFE